MNCRAPGGQITRIAPAEALTVAAENISDFEPFADLSEMTGLEAKVCLKNWFDG